MPVGGSNQYPSLETIAQLFRASINDTMAGLTDTPGEGLIMTDINPDTLTFLNSAIRDVYSDLRNVGDPELLLDNYVLLNLPPINSALGVGVQNPAAQCSLQVVGFFDGLQMWPQWTLPVSSTAVLRVWERLSGTNNQFSPMEQTLERASAYVSGRAAGVLGDEAEPALDAGSGGECRSPASLPHHFP